MTIISKTVGAAFALGLMAASASAATVSFTDADGLDGFSVAQFDATLGTLDSVDYVFNVGAVSTGVLTATATSSATFDGITGTDSETITGSGFVVASANANVSNTLTSGLAAFIGTGTLAGTFSAADFFAGGDLTITYTYTEAPVVPLPAGAPLLIGGLAGLAMLRRRKAKA